MKYVVVILFFLFIPNVYVNSAEADTILILNEVYLNKIVELESQLKNQEKNIIEVLSIKDETIRKLEEKLENTEMNYFINIDITYHLILILIMFFLILNKLSNKKNN